MTTKKTYLYIAEKLQKTYGHLRGFSERNVRKYCADNDIRSGEFVSDDRLEFEVEKAVHEVGQLRQHL